MNIDKEEKKRMDKLRSSTLYSDEKLYVIYTGKYVNFPKNKPIEVVPVSVMHSGLEYPEPKWIPANYKITDKDGDTFLVAKERLGKLEKGFRWVK